MSEIYLAREPDYTEEHLPRPEPLFPADAPEKLYPTDWLDKAAVAGHLPRGLTLPKKRRPGGHPTIDWHFVALMLAHGRSAAETAQAIGVSRTTLWRAIKKSHGLHDMIQQKRAEIAAQSGARVEALRERVAATLEEKLAEGDTRVLLWLAKQLGVVQTNYLIYYEAGRMGTHQPSPRHDAELAAITAEALCEPERPVHEMAFYAAQDSLPAQDLEEIGYASPPESDPEPAKPRKPVHTPEQQAWIDELVARKDFMAKVLAVSKAAQEEKAAKAETAAAAAAAFAGPDTLSVGGRPEDETPKNPSVVSTTKSRKQNNAVT